ncbi:MAG: integrase arm-type DNA-binding domain-containing protein [Sphingomonadales bacterium]|nr:integrase arm-type DNA-binding domain-containing protein [Sphingomonadales bacterium]
MRALQPIDRSLRKADGKGLYIEVMPGGSKLWRQKYRFAGKEKRLALGAYPEVTLAEARQRRDSVRRQIEEGIDPLVARKREKAMAKVSAEDSFERTAAEYIDKMEKEGRAEATLKKARWFADLLRPAIGSMPVSEVDPQLLLAALRKLEAKGNYETAKKTRSFASRVFRYAVATGRAKADPAHMLKGALVTPKARHYAAILEPGKLGELLRAIDDFDGQPVTKFALRIAPHVFVRPGELRHADWSEIDLGEAVWRIPAGRMKARRDHAVPLSRQMAKLFQELRALTGPNGFVFPAFHTKRRPLSENTLNAAFRRMGFGKDEVTAHGFRATASTLLNESGNWNPDAIERALAHGFSDAVRGTYHRGQHWEERVRMAQWWSDYLDQLRTGGAVLSLPKSTPASANT